MGGFSTYPFMNFMMTSKTTSEDIVAMFKETQSKGDIIVGNDVWIGFEATIMPGVKIGDGVIIGAKSVVTKDIEPYSIVAGNPAKVINKRFDENIIKNLLDIQWWNWDIENIEKNYSVITSDNMEAVIALHESS